MNKKLLIPLWIRKIMRLSFHQFLLCAILCGASYAHETSGQAVLEKRVSLDVQGVRFKKVLSMLGEQADVRFIYSSNSIDSQRKVTLKALNQTLELVLKELLNPYSIEFTVSDGKMISLTPVLPAKESSIALPERMEEKLAEEVSGRVVDEKGEALPGVSILVKGTQQGLITDAAGRFSMEVPDENAVLVFSFVGYLSEEVVVGNRTWVDISLKVDEKSLEEVIVIGYGGVKKQDLTGSVSSIKSNALKERAITTLSEAFAGQIAGVRAQQVSGKPGAELNIKIRGINSINASNAPLYVIDGIPFENMKDINPNDISSIEVLKDASSAAIYGARGSNGVVIISTKNGNKGKPIFDFSANYGLQKVDKIIDMMNRDEYIAFQMWGRNEAHLRSGGSMNDPISSRSSANQYPQTWLTNRDSLPDINWQKEIYRIAPIKNYQITASGGGEYGTFMVSGSYMKQDGIVENSMYDRVTFRLNTSMNVGRSLKLGMNIAPSFSTASNPDNESKESALHHAINNAPIVGLRSNTEEWGYTPGVFTWPNPLQRMKEVHQETRNNKVLTNAWVEFFLSKSMTFRSQYGYNFSEERNSYFRPSNVNTGAVSTGNSSTYDWYDWSFQNTITYNSTINSVVDINFLLGQSLERQKQYYHHSSSNGYPNDLIYTLNVASTPTGSSTTEQENSMMSYFARLNINMKDKYLMTLNIRHDGSSRFGRDNRWGLFPSASVGWKISNEEFIKNVDWIDLLKLRVFAGKAGNNRIGNYESVSLLGITNYSLNGLVVNGLSPSTIANPDLGWETKVSKGLGVDFWAFRNRVQATFDYYIDDTKDMLMSVPVSYISGYSSMRKNIGEIQNKGWEFELTTHNTIGKLHWNSSFNISRNSNRVKKLGEDNSPIIMSTESFSAYITKVGEPVGSYYMYKTDGLLLDNDFDANGNAIVPIARGQEKGNIKIVDINGDGEIDANDLTIVGNNLPDFIWGFNNRVSFKNIDLNILLQGNKGGELFFLGARHMDVGAINGQNSMVRWIRSYKPFNSGEQSPLPEGLDVDMSWDGKTPNRFGNNPVYNDTWIYDASFVRIKNVALGYNFSKSTCKRIGVQNIRIFVMGDNIFTWTTYPGATPETNSRGNDTTQPGTDYGTYPISRKYSLGLNLTF